MDGENNGKPLLNMGWFGGKTHYFRKHLYHPSGKKKHGPHFHLHKKWLALNRLGLMKNHQPGTGKNTPKHRRCGNSWFSLKRPHDSELSTPEIFNGLEDEIFMIFFSGMLGAYFQGWTELVSGRPTFIRKQLKWKFIGGVEDFQKIFENRHMVDFVANTLSVEKFLRPALRTPGVFINSQEKCRGKFFNIELHDWMLWVSFSRGTMVAYIFTMQR